VALTIDTDVCESTGVCAAVCPEDVLEFREGKPVIVALEQCTYCWICVNNCVSGAIELD
jgi:NAD-dependent dihydropyrimidine dehydrogenase PreA subunit